MTQRKGSQEYYLRQLERLFPGVKERGCLKRRKKTVSKNQIH
jgi:hypothetical protein